MKLTKSLKTDLVKHLRPRSPLLVHPLTTIRQTIARMQEQGQGCVLVCDDDHKVAGIFTERDILSRVIGERADLDSPIKEVMCTTLATVRESDRATRALQLLHRNGLRHLPIVDDSRQPVGLVTVRGVMEYLVDHFPKAVYNLPPNPSALHEAREGA